MSTVSLVLAQADHARAAELARQIAAFADDIGADHPLTFAVLAASLAADRLARAAHEAEVAAYNAEADRLRAGWRTP